MRQTQWKRELDYRPIKEVWAFRENRIAVRFAYEWHDDSGNWFRSYGNENWEFDEHGLMRVRIASINDLPIRSGERKYHWPLGRRPGNVAFTPSVKAIQTRRGSRRACARMEEARGRLTTNTPDVTAFIEAQTSVLRSEQPEKDRPKECLS